MAKKPEPLIRPVRKEGTRLYHGDGTERGEQFAKKLLAGAIKHLPDGAYEWELRPFVETRRARANRYYRGVVLKLIAETSGYTPNELHEIFKVRHNSTVVTDPESGEEMRIGQTTTTLKVDEFSTYLESCMADGAEWWGVSFPEPRTSEDWRAQPKGTRAA